MGAAGQIHRTRAYCPFYRICVFLVLQPAGFAGFIRNRTFQGQNQKRHEKPETEDLSQPGSYATDGKTHPASVLRRKKD